MNWKYVEPIRDPYAIRAFELDNNYTFPADFVSCVNSCNAGKPERFIFRMPNGQERLFNYLLSFNAEDPDSIQTLNRDTSHYIAFANDPFGNFWCFDRVSNAVVFWDHESGTAQHAADSFGAFLQQLAFPE